MDNVIFNLLSINLLFFIRISLWISYLCGIVLEIKTNRVSLRDIEGYWGRRANDPTLSAATKGSRITHKKNYIDP